MGGNNKNKNVPWVPTREEAQKIARQEARQAAKNRSQIMGLNNQDQNQMMREMMDAYKGMYRHRGIKRDERGPLEKAYDSGFYGADFEKGGAQRDRGANPFGDQLAKDRANQQAMGDWVRAQQPVIRQREIADMTNPYKHGQTMDNGLTYMLGPDGQPVGFGGGTPEQHRNMLQQGLGQVGRLDLMGAVDQAMGGQNERANAAATREGRGGSYVNPEMASLFGQLDQMDLSDNLQAVMNSVVGQQLATQPQGYVSPQQQAQQQAASAYQQQLASMMQMEPQAEQVSALDQYQGGGNAPVIQDPVQIFRLQSQKPMENELGGYEDEVAAPVPMPTAAPAGSMSSMSLADAAMAAANRPTGPIPQLNTGSQFVNDSGDLANTLYGLTQDLTGYANDPFNLVRDLPNSAGYVGDNIMQALAWLAAQTNKGINYFGTDLQTDPDQIWKPHY